MGFANVLHDIEFGKLLSETLAGRMGWMCLQQASLH